MSFILDALRKAENKNRDQHTMTVPSGPRVLNEELPEAPPAERNSAVVLVLMGAVLASALWWFMKPAPTTRVVSATTQSAPKRVASEASSRDQSPNAGAILNPAESQPGRQSAAAAETTPASNASLRRDTGARALDREALRGEVAQAPAANSTSAPAQRKQRNAATGTRTPNAAASVTPGTVRIMDADGNPPDDVVTPGRVEQEALPDYEQSLTNGGVPIPQLHLDIHVYSAEPAKRFVFINLDKYGEGDAIDKDTQVESIEPKGAIINHKGYRFVLRPD